MTTTDSLSGLRGDFVKNLVKRALVLVWLATTLGSWAAPLFPDVPDNYWAQDAVAALAAKGLVEGYPDGTFKGDRAATRWETAMVVARLLAKMEQAHGTFATKAELDELRKLTDALREELDALGVRVTNLEDSTLALDQRVTELERITFYGYSDTRMTFQSFGNDSNGGSPLGPNPVPYDRAVGTRVAAPWRPQVQGVIPVVDYRVGKALTNGTGFTSLAVLGLNIKVTPDVDAGAEFAAYTSQGDAFVDGYWGAPAPFLSNPTTAIGAAGGDLENTPYTKMTLDNFWVTHKPSGTKLLVGNIKTTTMNSLIYSGEPNLQVYGPKKLPGYGFQLSGSRPLGADQSLSWEVLGARQGAGPRFQGTAYQNNVLAANFAYQAKNGHLQADYARFNEEAPTGGNLLQVGLTNGLNVAYGASGGWATRQWVNPPGYFVGQLDPTVVSQLGALPNSADKRPIPGWNATADNAIGFGLGAGNYGPQEQQAYGLSGGYSLNLSDSAKLTFSGDIGRSQYRPNHNSAYVSNGNAVRGDVGLQLMNGGLNFDLEYLRVDPNFSPYGWNGNLLGARFIKTFNFVGTYHLYDNAKFPENREGFRLKSKWAFNNKSGNLWANASILEQTKTSLYDVRVTPGALGAGTPTNSVIGFAPGFLDPVF